jgi:hypothetical protein
MVQGIAMNRYEQLLNLWTGNGGRRSLYSLCKELDIDTNLAYVLLASPEEDVRRKIRAGKKFHYYRPGQKNEFIPEST